jgi:PAS domain S-box-containing protein
MDTRGKGREAAPARREREAAHTVTGALRELEADSSYREGAEEIRRLVHDLEVHRTELETQNRELRASQALLEESRARYADLYDFAPIAYLTLDLQGHVLEANLTATAFLGIERSNLIGRYLTSFVPDQSRGAIRAHLRACLTERLRVSTEAILTGRGGRRLVAQMVSTPLLGVDGQVTGCRTTLTDVSVAKQAQEAMAFLAQASALLSSSFDYAGNIAEVARLAVPALADVCIADVLERDGKLTRIEIAVHDATRERMARAGRRVAPRHDRTSALGAVLETGRPLLIPEYRPFSGAASNIGVDHESFVRACMPRSVMYVPMLARGEPLGVFTLATSESGRQFGETDLTTAEDLANRAAMAIENARLYDDAQRAVRAREQTMSFVSHDLKNPLMGMLIGIETLLASAPAAERRRGWKQLERMRRGLQQMRHMVEDLLDMASIDAGRLAVQPADTDVGDVLEDVIELLRPIARDKQIELRADLAPEARRARCDRDRIVQVLYNLIGNALKFTPAAGRVWVEARAREGKAQIAVNDNGPGVPADLLPHLFERFAQASATARQGRGLGLYISRRIVEAHAGTIWLDAAVEAGARFCFTLPLAPAPAVPGAEAEVPSTDRPQERAPADGRPVTSC